MAARTKPAKKTYPAKRAAGTRKASLPAVLDVQVTCFPDTFTVTARGKSASSKVSAAGAVRSLAKLLGYNASADVRYLRTDGEAQHFQIVEVSP